MKKRKLQSQITVLGRHHGGYQVLTESGAAWHVFRSLFAEHLLGRLLEVRTTLVIELLLRVSCSSLGLCVLEWLLPIVLILVGCWSLLHSHHGGVIGCSALTTNSITDSTFSWHNRVLLSVLLLNLWLLSDNIKHTVLKCFFIFAQSILFPSVIEDLWV